MYLQIKFINFTYYLYSWKVLGVALIDMATGPMCVTAAWIACSSRVGKIAQEVTLTTDKSRTNWHFPFYKI